jgi:hypothetical protein
MVTMIASTVRQDNEYLIHDTDTERNGELCRLGERDWLMDGRAFLTFIIGFARLDCRKTVESQIVYAPGKGTAGVVALLRAMDISPDDRIMAVNGVHLVSRTGFDTAVESAERDRILVLDIKKGDRLFTHTYLITEAEPLFDGELLASIARMSDGSVSDTLLPC